MDNKRKEAVAELYAAAQTIIAHQGTTYNSEEASTIDIGVAAGCLARKLSTFYKTMRDSNSFKAAYRSAVRQPVYNYTLEEVDVSNLYEAVGLLCGNLYALIERRNAFSGQFILGCVTMRCYGSDLVKAVTSYKAKELPNDDYYTVNSEIEALAKVQAAVDTLNEEVIHPQVFQLVLTNLYESTLAYPATGTIKYALVHDADCGELIGMVQEDIGEELINLRGNNE